MISGGPLTDLRRGGPRPVLPTRPDEPPTAQAPAHHHRHPNGYRSINRERYGGQSALVRTTTSDPFIFLLYLMFYGSSEDYTLILFLLFCYKCIYIHNCCSVHLAGVRSRSGCARSWPSLPPPPQRPPDNNIRHIHNQCRQHSESNDYTYKGTR